MRMQPDAPCAGQPSPHRPLSRAERGVCALVSVLVLLFSSLPYIYGYARQSRERRFTGIVFDVVDTAQYYAWMRAFAHQPLIANPLTPEPGSPRFFNLQWWLLGQVAYNTPLGPSLTYQLLRVAAVGAFAVALVAFCRIALPRQVLLGFVLTMLSSGFGWVLVVAKQFNGELRYPLAVQIAEANTFFSAMAFPHLLVASALTLGIFTLFLSTATAGGRGTRRQLVILATLVIALGFSHGYDLLPAMAIPCATIVALAWRERRLPRAIWPGAVILAAAAIPALYLLLLTRLDATWKGVLSQYGNAGVFTPPPPQLLILLGLPFVLALPQLRPSAWREADLGGLFLRMWLLAGFALLYIPTGFQVKMLTAYQVPIALLAAQSLHEVYPRVLRIFYASGDTDRPPGRQTIAWLAVLVGFVALTNVYLTSWRIVDLRRADYPYFLTAGDVQALQLVGEIGKAGDIVLSSPELGVFVPVYSDARPFVAHWAQTLQYYARRRLAASVYRTTTSEPARLVVLETNDITYVLAGPAEASLGGSGMLPDFHLEMIANGTTILYRTRSPLGVWP